MKPLRILFVALLALLIAPVALASEQITSFDVAIDVQTDGDIVVAETIRVTAEGNEIRRGIFRDLPRFYLDANGNRLAYEYRVLAVERDGAREPYDTETEDNAFRIRIGDEDVLIPHGAHTYLIRYEIKNQVRYFADYDELYWNATGNYWNFPILHARATVTLPDGAAITQTAGYTGGEGQSGGDYTYKSAGNRHTFETTRTLEIREGLTIAIGFAKGLIDPPSAADRGAAWWQRFGALSILGISLVGLFWFLYRGFSRVGRDPAKGPVFPRYEPPSGYSPAATHHIFYRGVQGHRALIATLMNLAVKGRLSIDASDKKKTVLTRASASGSDAIAGEDTAFAGSLFAGRTTKSLGGSYDSGFTSAYTRFQQTLGKKYGEAYFRWNVGYTLTAIALTVLVIMIAAFMVVQWTIWHTLAVVALAALNAVFLYLMPAPTQKGQAIRTEIEGFRLYLEKAEKLQLDAVEPGSSAPPPMTTERYEKFLPYAVALGIEEPWTKHFERLLPEEAANYHPTWTNMSTSRSLGALTGAMVANMSSGVSSSLPQSSSSSGSGGGGSSGGGGGGGGGGGW